MKKETQRVYLAGLVLGLLLPSISLQAAPVKAERREEFKEHHPRRAEVNARVRNQRMALHRDLKSGKITKQQYDMEIAKLNNVKREEVSEVKANGGYLKKDQQKDLNQDLNHTRKDINGMNGAPSAPPPPSK